MWFTTQWFNKQKSTSSSKWLAIQFTLNQADSQPKQRLTSLLHKVSFHTPSSACSVDLLDGHTAQSRASTFRSPQPDSGAPGSYAKNQPLCQESAESVQTSQQLLPGMGNLQQGDSRWEEKLGQVSLKERWGVMMTWASAWHACPYWHTGVPTSRTCAPEKGLKLPAFGQVRGSQDEGKRAHGFLWSSWLLHLPNLVPNFP